MKRKMAYILVIGVMLLIPAHGIDVGRLRPVEAVQISQKEGSICIRTDTGDIGTGENLEEAYEDMKKTSSGNVFLDTAAYLIIEGEAPEREILLQYFRPKSRICRASGEVDICKAVQYLALHRPEFCLKEYDPKKPLQVLEQKENGFLLS